MKVLYVLKRYPRLSETFVVRELLGLEAAGALVGIDALSPAEEGPRHPEVDAVAATVRYLGRASLIRRHDVWQAHLRVLLAHPARWSALAWQCRPDRLRRSGRPGSPLTSTPARPWKRFVQAGMVADRVRLDGFDHVHAHFASSAAEVAGMAATLAGVPFTVTAHAKDIYAAEHAPHLLSRVRGAAAVVTVSDYNRVHLTGVLAVLGAAAPPVVRVDNGMALPAAVEPQPEGPLLCVARLVPKKGLDTLLDAFALISAQRPALRLEIIGSGPLESALRALSERLGVSEQVRFLGAQAFPAVEAAYRRASMLVLACRVADDGDRDGLPTVIIEAAGRGLPVVSTDVVGIGEVLRSGDTGMLVPPGNPSALAAAVADLLDDPARAARMGRRGRQLVAARFDPAITTSALLQVFEQAAHHYPPGPGAVPTSISVAASTTPVPAPLVASPVPAVPVGTAPVGTAPVGVLS